MPITSRSHFRSALLSCFILVAAGFMGCADEDECNGLPTPFNVSATWSSEGIHLSWQGDCTNIGVYYVQRAVGMSGTYEGLLWVGAYGPPPGIHGFSTVDRHAQPGVNYCYRILSQHYDGTQGCWSDPVCVSVRRRPIPIPQPQPEPEQPKPNLVLQMATIDFSARTVQVLIGNIGTGYAGAQDTEIEINEVTAADDLKPQSHYAKRVPRHRPRSFVVLWPHSLRRVFITPWPTT